MTVLNTESRIGMTTAQMPRVNLLPPEIAERAAFRKLQVGLGAGLAVTVGVVGLLLVSASHSVSSAQEQVDAASSKNAQLTSETAKYRNVTAVYSAAAAAQSQLVTAMGQEVRYSQLMHDLSLSVPSTVWLKSMSYTQANPTAPAAGAPVAGTAAPAATGAAAPAAAGATATALPSIGTVAFVGIGFDHDDLALWLESVAGLKQYGNVYFTNSTEGLLGQRKIVNFATTADLSAAALSGRYLKPLGG